MAGMITHDLLLVATSEHFVSSLSKLKSFIRMF